MALPNGADAFYFNSMVMVMMSKRCATIRVTVFFMAILLCILHLKRCVPYAIFLQFFFNPALYTARIPLRNNVHRGAIVMSIHAPHMNVVNIQYALDFPKMRFDLIHRDASRGLFKKNIQGLLHVFYGIDKIRTV